MTRHELIALIFLPVLGALPIPAQVTVCSVPGTHVTIQEAVDDPLCTEIDLASQTYSEPVEIHRTLALIGSPGGNSVIADRLSVEGEATVVELLDLSVQNGCPSVALPVADGAELNARGLEVVRQSGLACSYGDLFTDGFESGDTSAWSATVP